MTKERRKLRSSAWFGGEGKNAFMHRSWMKNQGIPDDLFDGRPRRDTPARAPARGRCRKPKVRSAGLLPRPSGLPGSSAPRLRRRRRG